MSRSVLRQHLCRALPGFEPGLRVVAEGLPARDGTIDLLGIDHEGRLVVVCAEPDESEPDTALAFARLLSTRDWLLSEMPGWLQLVPGLELGVGSRRRSEIRCLLVVRALPPAVRSAIAALPAGWIEPMIHRPYSHRGDVFLLLESVDPGARRERAGETGAEPGDKAGAPAVRTDAFGPLADPAPPDGERPLPRLRSGLTKSDFQTPGRGAGRARRAGRSRPRFDATPDRDTTSPRDALE